jgi:histidinol-phosphatase
MTSYEEELTFALNLCDDIDRYTLESFEKREFSVTTKADCTPVTEIDQETERRIRAALLEKYPDDAIEGEEFGTDVAGHSRVWVVDPIDGTKNYLRGVPVWGTLIALCVDDQPVMGVISAPSLHRRWWATKGSGAYLNGKQIHVSKVDDISMCEGSYGNYVGFVEGGYEHGVERLVNNLSRVRALGDFWSHMLVAEGALEVGLDPVCAPWDIAPVKIIVEEAGGKFTSFDGDDSFRKGSGISTNGLIHEELRAIASGI